MARRLFFSAGSLNPAMCVVRGAGLRKATAGVGSVVEIAAHDAEGNVLFHSDMSGSEFVASLATRWTTVDCVSRCFDRGDGTYRLAYTTFTARTGLLLSITGRGAHVKGSPFAIDVVSGRAHAPHCHVHGAELRMLSSVLPRTVSWSTHDRWRNPCTSGGERIHVRFAGQLIPSAMFWTSAMALIGSMRAMVSPGCISSLSRSSRRKAVSSTRVTLCGVCRSAARRTICAVAW